MSDAVIANLSIEINVTCPNCDYYINLLDESDTNGVWHDDCGYLMKQACPDGHWSEKHENFTCEGVVCTQCKHEFNVKGLGW